MYSALLTESIQSQISRSADSSMASPGPPPYSQEQIAAMTSPEERIRAFAELKSRWKKRR